jgi:hypothetical protein
VRLRHHVLPRATVKRIPALLIWEWQDSDQMLPTNWWDEWFYEFNLNIALWPIIAWSGCVNCIVTLTQIDMSTRWKHPGLDPISSGHWMRLTEWKWPEVSGCQVMGEKPNLSFNKTNMYRRNLISRDAAWYYTGLVSTNLWLIWLLNMRYNNIRSKYQTCRTLNSSRIGLYWSDFQPTGQIIRRILRNIC